jgi:hypothetical protein
MHAPLLVFIFAAASSVVSYMAAAKSRSSAASKKNSPPCKSSDQSKKAASPTFKTTFAPLLLKGGTDVNVMFERVIGAHLTIFYLQSGGN